jgi:hypothetical protein
MLVIRLLACKFLRNKKLPFCCDPHEAYCLFMSHRHLEPSSTTVICDWALLSAWALTRLKSRCPEFAARDSHASLDISSRSSWDRHEILGSTICSDSEGRCNSHATNTESRIHRELDLQTKQCIAITMIKRHQERHRPNFSAQRSSARMPAHANIYTTVPRDSICCSSKVVPTLLHIFFLFVPLHVMM